MLELEHDHEPERINYLITEIANYMLTASYRQAVMATIKRQLHKCNIKLHFSNYQQNNGSKNNNSYKKNWPKKSEDWRKNAPKSTAWKQSKHQHMNQSDRAQSNSLVEKSKDKSELKGQEVTKINKFPSEHATSQAEISQNWRQDQPKHAKENPWREVQSKKKQQDKDQVAKEQATQQRKTRDMAMRKVRSELGNEVYYKIDHRLQNALIDAELKREDQQRQSFRDPPKPNETFRKH